jgi:hypothetical protein
MPALTLGCSLPCSVVAASAEPQRAAVVLRLANLVVVNQPLPVRAAGRRSSTRERSRLSRHHAASQADAARPNQAAAHLPPRHVVLSAERTAEHVLQLVEQTVEHVLQLVEQTVEHVLQLAVLVGQTAPLHVQATVLRHVHHERVAVLLHVHRPVLQLADQMVLTAPHHVRRTVLQPVVQTVVQTVVTERTVLQLADLTEPTVLHHVHPHVLLPVVQGEPTVLHHVHPLADAMAQAVLQPAVPRVPAAATIVAVQTLAKSLS